MSSQGILSGDVIFHVICKDLFVILYFVPLTTAYPWLSASSMEVFFNLVLEIQAKVNWKLLLAESAC